MTFRGRTAIEARYTKTQHRRPKMAIVAIGTIIDLRFPDTLRMCS